MLLRVKPQPVQLAKQIPKHNPGADRDVERMLGAELRNLHAKITEVDDSLLHSFNFVAEYKGVSAVGSRGEVVEHDAGLGLLDGNEYIIVLFQLMYGVGSVGKILPFHAVLGAERGLVNLGRGRRGGDSAEQELLDKQGVASAEDRSDIVLTANVIQYHRNGGLDCRVELVATEPIKLTYR